MRSVIFFLLKEVVHEIESFWVAQFSLFPCDLASKGDREVIIGEFPTSQKQEKASIFIPQLCFFFQLRVHIDIYISFCINAPFDLILWLSFVVIGPRGLVYLYFIRDDAIFARVSEFVELKFSFAKEDVEQCFYRKYNNLFLFCSSFFTLFHSESIKT